MNYANRDVEKKEDKQTILMHMFGKSVYLEYSMFKSSD